MFVEGGAVTLFGLAALTVLRRFEDKEDNLSNRRVSVTMRAEPATLEQVSAELTRSCLEIVQVDYESHLGPQRSALAIFDVRMVTGMPITRLVRSLELVAGVERVRVQNLG